LLDEDEENIEQIIAKPDHKEFTIGLWGQVNDKKGKRL
jgi:hypothetical protein